MSRANVSQETKDAARAALLNVLHDGDTVYTVLRSVSRSGMSRRIDLYFFKVEMDVTPLFLSNYVKELLGIATDTIGKQGIRVNGCGMDMGFHLVNSISKALNISLVQRWL